MWALLWWVGCVPVLEDRSPYVDAPRLLAVRAVPAEVSAGAEVTLEPLFADGAGRISPAPLDWSFCTALKPLAELGPVAAGEACAWCRTRRHCPRRWSRPAGKPRAPLAMAR